MYCLDKLQRELAYFFSKDIRELPKVESLLAEAGYTQIRKGDEIIEIDSALGRHSADLGDSRAVITDKVTPTLESPKDHESPTATPRILEREAAQSTDSTSQNKRSGASVAQQVSLEILESKAGKDTPKSLESPTSPTATPRILEREAAPSLRADEIGAAIHKANTQEIHKETPSTQAPAETPAQKVDSSVESIAPKDTQTQPTQKSLFDEVDSSESKTKHEQSEQTKAILTPTEAREIIPKQIFNFDDNGYLLKELTRQEAESLSKDSREMLEYFNKVFDGIDSIKVKQYIKDTYTDAQKGYDHLRRVNSRIYEDILQEYLKNKFKHNQLAKNIDEYGEYVEEYYTKMMDNLKSLEKEKKIFKELERIDAIVKNENETPAQKVDSSVESIAPKDTQTQPTQKSLFDEVDSSEPNFTYTTGEAKGIAELRKDLKQSPRALQIHPNHQQRNRAARRGNH